ncbi:hypothetical protein Tco_0393799, partial [Tanacetum coccineum]
MDDPNITIEEYIRLEEEKAQKRGKVFNWETAKYCKIWYDEDVLNLRSVETEFPAIVFNDNLTSNKTPSCEPTVSSLNDEIDFRISFDESDDEEYTVVFDKNSFSYKIISTNDLKTDSENDNEKVNKPLFQSPEPTVSCIDDLEFFKDFENEFPTIIYNDALTSKSEFSTEPTLCPQHIDEFDFKDETSLSEYVEEEQNVLYFNDLFPFNIIYPDDLKSDKGNDDNKIDMIQSSGDMAPLPPRDQRHLWLRYQVDGYTEEIDLAERLRMVYTRDDGQEVFVSHDWRRLFEIRAPLVQEFILEFFSTCRIGSDMGLDVADTLCFQLGGARRSMTWRQFILALGLHTVEEMTEEGFGAYGLGSERVIPDKGDLSDYWVEIYSGRNFLRGGRHLKRHAKGRKSGARLAGGHFIGRLAHHFGLVSDDGLRGLSIVTYDLPLIDMGELVKLNICKKIRDDWDWVAPGPERHQVAADGAPKAVEDAPVVVEGVQADLAPGLQQDVRSLRELVERSMTDQDRFSTWMISCMTQLMEASGRTYQAFDGTIRGSYPAVFERRTR